MSPWLSTRLCPAAPSAGVTDGQLAPSTGANSGSLPPLAAKTACASWALRPNALPCRWQLPQLRPLVPRLRKKGLPASIAPVVLTVPIWPVGSESGTCHPCCRPRGPAVRWATGAPGPARRPGAGQPRPPAPARFRGSSWDSLIFRPSGPRRLVQAVALPGVATGRGAERHSYCALLRGRNSGHLSAVLIFMTHARIPPRGLRVSSDPLPIPSPSASARISSWTPRRTSSGAPAARSSSSASRWTSSCSWPSGRASW